MPSTELEWYARFTELRALGDGWNDEDPDSKAITESAFRGGASVMYASLDLELDRPGIFPGVEGGISFEWSTPEKVIQILAVSDSWFECFILDEKQCAKEMIAVSYRGVKDFIRGNVVNNA